MSEILLPEFPKVGPVCRDGEFVFAAAGLDHGHINGQAQRLIWAGGTLKWVFDPDGEKVAKFREIFPQARVARSFDEILDDPEIRLVTAAPVPVRRAEQGIRVMRAGKDYFVDKSPLTTLDHLAEVRRVTSETGRKFIGNYSERIGTESGVLLEYLLRQGVIGEVVQIIGLGPHKLNAASRPEWFFDKEAYGGILVDLACHQADQFLAYTGAEDVRVVHAAVDNFTQREFPGLEDFGEMALVDEKQRRGYARVDWLTPKGLPVFGDGRTLVMGTKGTIEVRKYIDLGRDQAEQIHLVTDEGQTTISAKNTIGLPFFGQLILDCLNRTETAMTQEHSLKAVEICLQAQALADRQRKAC